MRPTTTFAQSGGTCRVILVDSTAWIDLLRRRETIIARRLRRLLDTGEAAVAPVIVQELLQGAATPSAFDKLRKYFLAMPCLGADRTLERCMAAAGLYARARWRAIAPRSPHDCLIAVTAIDEGVALLHDDADFERLALVDPRLQLVPRA